MRNALDPNLMTAAERLREIGEILAAGLIRLRARRREAQAAGAGDVSLDFPAHQSVHGRTLGDGENAMNDSVLAQLAALPEKSTAELKQLWRELYDREPPPLQQAVPGQASRLPHPGTGLRRAVGARRGEAEGADRGGGSAAQGQAAGAQG